MLVLVSRVCNCPPRCQSVIVSSVLSFSLAIREVASRNSPSKLVSQLKLSSASCDIIVAVAENDSPEFRKQSEEYYKVSATDRTQVILIRLALD